MKTYVNLLQKHKSVDFNYISDSMHMHGNDADKLEHIFFLAYEMVK